MAQEAILTDRLVELFPSKRRLDERQIVIRVGACLPLELLELVQIPANLVSYVSALVWSATNLQHLVPCAKSVDSPSFQSLVVQFDELVPFEVLEIVRILVQSQSP